MASERFGPPFVFPQSPPPPAPIHNMKKGYWSFSYQTQSWKFLTNNVNKLLITTHPIRNLWTQAAAEMNKRGFLRRVSLSFSPQSPLFSSFPLPFQCLHASYVYQGLYPILSLSVRVLLNSYLWGGCCVGFRLQNLSKECGKNSLFWGENNLLLYNYSFKIIPS